MSDFYPNIFNIPASCPFWDNIASIYLSRFSDNPLKLASVSFLVSNRRNCIALTNAFMKKQNMHPTILPQIIPINETDVDELFFSYFGIENITETNHTPISREERLFLLTRMIISKPNEFGIKKTSLTQALNLAENLANLLDTCYNQDLSFDKLNELVPEKYAYHWQETLDLLKIITKYWPEILKERKAIDICDLKNHLLRKKAIFLKNNDFEKHIVIAGVTASFPSFVELMKTVIELKNGEIYFSGIDKLADNEYWDAIDEMHPQFELKDLLKKLQLDRLLIKDHCLPSNIFREHFISEVMRPAIVSDKWSSLQSVIDGKSAVKGIQVINSKNQREEALAIALKMREILEEEDKTACLVTYDRNLARRVSAELKRFNIEVDDSAGIPLSLTPIGIFLRLIVEYCLDTKSDIKMMDLLKNPFTLMKQNINEYKDKIYNLEKYLRDKEKHPISNENNDFLIKLKELVKDFSDSLKKTNIDFNELLKLHLNLAEELASSDSKEGKNFLWCGDIAKSMANFITKILETSDLMGKIKGSDYLSILSLLMNRETYRTKYGTHPRLCILGPIEAQLQHFDYIIIGEANEGIWPKLPKADMWMSRPMMSDFGFNLPEKNIGILAFGFTKFMMTENVIITRAERIGESPTQKSRWIFRLETMMKALGLDIKDIEANGFVSFIHTIDKPKTITPIKPPSPRPPLHARPRKLSASGLDLLIDDPYSVFAKYILKLYPLNDLDRELDQRDFGNLVHNIIEDFNNQYNSLLPHNSLDILIDIGKTHFKNQNLKKEVEVFWWPKFLTIAKWVIEQEKEYRTEVKSIHNEINGEIKYDLPCGQFTFTAKADRIDELLDGSINIIDYKTGSIPTKTQVETGHAMQLLLEGIIAQNGAYAINSNNTVNKLIYYRLGKEKLIMDSNLQELLDKSKDYIIKLVNTFDFETTPYHSRPTPKYIPKNKDYEHLARIREWSVHEEGEDGDE